MQLKLTIISFFFDAQTSMSPTIKIGTIPIDSIKSINIEDASSFNKKLSLGRVMLVGVFALAWKKEC